MISDLERSSTTTSQSVTGVIPAPAARLYHLLTDPAQHPTIDGSAMVRSPQSNQRLDHIGQEFVMDMVWKDGSKEYAMVNTVTALQADQLVEWAPAEQDNPEVTGWRWRWELSAFSATSTQVTVTCDWSAVAPELLAEKSFPVVDSHGMEESLKRLAAAACG